MRDRNKRENARRRDFMDWQHARERDYGHDQPWREERREADREDRRAGRGWDIYAREGDRARAGFGSSTDAWNAGGSFGFGPEEGPEDRDHAAYGSPYGQGDLNSDRTGRGDWRDTDWMPNRPARGRGTWAGDWGDTRSTSGTANYAGRGPKEYRRSDDRIREEVCDLFTDDPGLDASEVSVKVEGGEITLMGSVTTREQKRRAEDIAERVSGVRDVINQLRVARGETTIGTTSGKEKAARGGATSQPSVAADKGDR